MASRMRDPLMLCAERRRKDQSAQRRKLAKPDPQKQLDLFSPLVDLAKVRSRLR